jgi:hypothetical protein
VFPVSGFFTHFVRVATSKMKSYQKTNTIGELSARFFTALSERRGQADLKLEIFCEN